MAYKVMTYIAGDWDNDIDLIDELYRMNDSDHYPLNFIDAHSLKQARDDSLYCSVKKSLSDRMDESGTFVLVVGDHTRLLTKGCCFKCGAYSAETHTCPLASNISHKSYIDFECDKAVRDGLKIVVIYKDTIVDKSKCPDSVRDTGTHIPAYDYQIGRGRTLDWFNICLAI